MKQRNKVTILIILILLLSFSGYKAFSGTSTPKNLESLVATKMNLREEVSITGKVTPIDHVNLAFERGGKVVSIYGKEGQEILKNTAIVVLDTSELSADYRRSLASLESTRAQTLQYTAALNIQKARLDELKKGSRQEDIDIKKSELKDAEQGLTNLYTESVRIMQNAYNLADEAVRIKTAGMFSGSKSSSYKITFIACDLTAQSQVESERLISEGELERWNTNLSLIFSSSNSSLEIALDSSKTSLIIFQNFFLKASYVLNTGCAMGDDSLDTYRSNISSARSNINTAISIINSHKEKIASQKNAIEKAKNELQLKLAGSTPEQISAQEFQVKQSEASLLSQEALVRQYEASVQLISAQIAKNILRSPINGIITKQSAKVGEIVAPNTPIVSVISKNAFEIEANVAEVDVAKIKIGNPAKITLDAYGNDTVFSAKVVFIDSAETVIEGVSTYKITLQFDQDDSRIKSGMTANIDMTTNTRENVVAVPQRAIIQKNNGTYVQIINKETSVREEKKVLIGLRASDGNVEIIEGILEGENVVVYENEK